MTPWLKIAESELGVHEFAGEAANPIIVQWFADCGHPEITSDEVPNCAAALGSWLKRAGIKGTGALNARSYLDWGINLEEPVLGCIVVFDRPPDPDAGHVAIFKRLVGNQVEVHGANQNDCVSVTRFPADRVINYRWPTGVPLTDTVAEVKAGSTKFNLMTLAQRAILGIGTPGLGLTMAPPDLTTSIGAIGSAAKIWKDYGPIGLLIGFILIMYFLEVLKAKTVEDAASGRYTPSGETKPKAKEAT